MRKIVLIAVGVLMTAIMLFISPIVYDVLRSVVQMRTLQNRSDYPQIATECVALSLAITNDSPMVSGADPRVPALLRSLSPKYIDVSSNYVVMEFHGGFDHYGYRVRRSDTDPKQWTISFYTEQGQKLLTTISLD